MRNGLDEWATFVAKLVMTNAFPSILVCTFLKLTLMGSERYATYRSSLKAIWVRHPKRLLGPLS
jgi:hypothetical protein